MGGRLTAKRIHRISPSPMFQIFEKVKEMERQGVKIIHFEAGEPEYDTPAHIKDAAKKALDEGYTRYTPRSGLPELREAIAEKLLEEDGIEIDPYSEIMVTIGAKYGIFSVFLTAIEEGDEVLLPDPSFTATRDALILIGGKPVFIPLEEEKGFELRLDALKEKITPRTKAILLNYPHNPTGWVPSKREIEAIVEIAQEHNLLIITDEIYEKIVFDGRKHHRILSFPEVHDKTVMVSSFSKTYAMTGWRVGYAISKDKSLIKKMLMVQGSSVTCAAAFAQKAAIAALKGPQDFIEDAVNTYERRRNFVVNELNRIRGISCRKPMGTFYVFPNVATLEMSSMDLAIYLLNKAKVALMPGVGFGEAWDNHLRLSITETDENIKEGLNLIKVAIEKLR